MVLSFLIATPKVSNEHKLACNSYVSTSVCLVSSSSYLTPQNDYFFCNSKKTSNQFKTFVFKNHNDKKKKR